MTRTEKILEARRLKTLGRTSPQIGRQLGVSDSTVRNWCLGGTCPDCGAPTEGSNAKRSERCPPCYEIARAAVHGTRSKYNAGCRCSECRQSQSSYMREFRARRQAA